MLRLGELELDVAARTLSRNGAPVALADRHLSVFIALVTRAGEIVGKNDLARAGWDDVAVTDNSIEQAISALRRIVGNDEHGRSLIETVPRRGYRFRGVVVDVVAEVSDATLDALLAPHRAWIEGRAALETLDVDAAGRAEVAFRRLVASWPHLSAGHIGLANALVFRFEATRADLEPDTKALVEAQAAAHLACRLDAASGEAWATHGFVLHRAGRVDDARAALRRAVALEPDNWRHHVRSAFVEWGEERLRAASRTLRLVPGLALAHWLSATVHVARQAFDDARRSLDEGAAAQDDQCLAGGAFPSVGLHWLRGLVLHRLGDTRAARDALERELAMATTHVYAREVAANTYYALGALALRSGDRAHARRGFEGALRLVPGHAFALLASSAIADAGPVRMGADHRATGLALAMAECLRGRHDAAAQAVLQMLTDAPAGPDGWFFPLDPILCPHEHPDAWAGVLSVLRVRAR